MTDGYKPPVDERRISSDHPYWNALCYCMHPRREHSQKACLMAGCACTRFVVYYDDASFRQPLPFSYA